MTKNKKLIITIAVLAIVAALVVIDVALNDAASIKLILSIFLPGIIAPEGSSVSDGLQSIAVIPDIWIVCLAVYGITSSLKPKTKHTAA